MSETIAKAYASFNSISEEKAFLSYLFTIASRTYYRMIAMEKRNNYLECDFENLLVSNLNLDETIDIEELYYNLNKLPKEQKETLILFYIEGFSRKECAEIQKVSEETVKSRLSRGKKTMAKLMGAHLDYEN